MSAFRHMTSCFALIAATGMAHAQATDQEDVMVVFDGSNSMWGQIDGTAKIEIARSVMGNLLGDWTADRQIGLMAYGHRRRGDCSDIETLITPASGTAPDILERINAITPTGKTPLTDAVEQAATALAYTDRPATVVLISDGLESCERDPCELARALEKGGVGFTAHVVGFGLANDEDAASLACIAEETGGQYISASNASELGDALSDIGTAVAEPEPEPELPEVTLTAPDSVVVGGSLIAGWSTVVERGDYVTFAAPDMDAENYISHVSTNDKSEGELRAATTPGTYELRYVHAGTGDILGRRDIAVTEHQITLTVPESVATGAEFEVSWTDASHPSDYITIVPQGADQGTYGDYLSVRDNSSVTLTAPADAGLYEVRYLFNIDETTALSQPVEVTDVNVTLTAPDTALIGSSVVVEWSDTIAPEDYITVVSVGAEDSQYTNYILTRDNSKGALRMPAVPGMYELRYVLREGRRVIARHALELTEPEVTLSAPDTALAGSDVKISWTGTVDDRDYITIVPAGAEEGTHTNYILARDNTEGEVKAPADPGLYEIRYILREGRRTMARRTLEITEPEVSLTAPDKIRAGDTIKVGWSTPVDSRDYIALAPVGSEPGSQVTYILVRAETEGKLEAPDEAGMYEIRYILREGGRVLASNMIEVLPTDAQLQSGATIEAPEIAAAGSTIDVGFTTASTSADRRITLARADQAIFTWVNAVKIDDEASVRLTLPDTPGTFELRFLDVTEQEVLARKIITVE